jgi:hypothetical protein
MIGNEKTVFPGHIFLQGFNALIFKLKDIPTSEADEMVVVLPPSGRFKGAHLTVEFPFHGQSALGQELQGPVNRGQTHPLVLFSDLGKEFLGRDVPLLG